MRFTVLVPRLFLAIWPPAEVIAELRLIRRKDQRGVRFVLPENWHVTLRFLGEADPDQAIAAMDAAALPATRARLGPGVDVLGDRALVVPVSGVDELAEIVTGATEGIGERPPKRHFSGHLTLARIKPRAAMPPAIGALVSAEFDVHEVALVRSRLEPTGARYETIATWPTN